jgi:hypothetical protein
MTAVYQSNDGSRRAVAARRHLGWRARLVLVSLLTTAASLLALFLKAAGVF